MKKLQVLLPSSVKPVIVTDAGFRVPWFKEVRALGWDFVGRMRSKNLVRFEGSSEWHLSRNLYEKASENPTYLGSAAVTKDSRFNVNLFTYKGPSKNRHKINKNKTECRTHKSKKHAQANKEPWLLSTSLKANQSTAMKVVKIYKTRMQIEETFRDTKSTRYGFSLQESISKSPERSNVLLLIAAIASFACLMVGIQMKYEGRASDFQSHSSKCISALSILFLGREAIKKKVKTTKKQFLFFLRNLPALLRYGQIMMI